MPTITLPALIDLLRQKLGSDAIVDDAGALDSYSADWSARPPHRPELVVRPASTDEVSLAVALCNEHGWPVATQGGRTGMSGGAVPAPGEIVLSLERMNRIVEIDPVTMTLTVEAGATLQSVQEAAEAAGFQFPLDLGSRGSCTIGGAAATNAGGNRVIRYGMMADMVRDLEAVLAVTCSPETPPI